MIAVAAIIIYYQRLRHKKEKQLSREKEANLLLQQQQSQKELELARQQLNDLVKSFEEKEKYKENITSELLSMSEKTGELPLNDSISKKILELINTNLLTNEDWQMFQLRFEKVYSGFFAGLNMAIPGISPAEERLMALLKLNINNRQMAAMLGITAESVRKAKYRLRKKLSANGQIELLNLLDEPIRA